MASKKEEQPNSPVTKIWKPDLYKIQLQAPTPKPLFRSTNDMIDYQPPYYGLEYHGNIDHKEAEKRLCDTPDGTYIIRKSPGANDFSTLCIRFDEKTKNFKLYFNTEKGHFLKEDFKQYESVNNLVADGLINFYMSKIGAPILLEMNNQTMKDYQESPYLTLNKRKLRAISNEMRRSQVLTCSDKHEEGAKAQSITGNFKEAPENDILPVVYEKPHHFKSNNFKGLNWCELCANFLWGFTAQGVKCEDCGFIAHFKCSLLVPAKCVPDLKQIRGVFGVDLTTVVSLYKCTLPFVVKKCVEEIEKRGLFHEGIYRISGFADEIETLKLALDREGEKTIMSENVYSNINVIAGTLKLYLRLLPVPLITFQTYPTFMRAVQCKSIGEQIIAIREALKELPVAHLNCLKYILEHLNRVAAHQAVNKMNEHNIATVFAPTLIYTPQNITDLSQEIYLLNILITHCQTIFL